MPRTFYPGERTSTHCMEAGWAPGPVWTAAENLAPTRIRTLDLQPIASAIPTELPWPTDSTKVINFIIKVYTGLHVMILARHILAKRAEDAKPCTQNTLHIRSNDDIHVTHTNK